MTDIHPTAVIEDGAQIAASAKIGPFAGLALVLKSVRTFSSWAG